MQWEQNHAYNLYQESSFKYKTASDADEARLDALAENIWLKNRQKAFFDVKVFNPLQDLMRMHHLLNVIAI